jgi:hypothetical protein
MQKDDRKNNNNNNLYLTELIPMPTNFMGIKESIYTKKKKRKKRRRQFFVYYMSIFRFFVVICFYFFVLNLCSNFYIIVYFCAKIFSFMIYM